MKALADLFWLGGMVLGILGFLWFITLPLLLLAAASWMAVKKDRPGAFRSGWIVMAIQGGTTMLILLLGAAFTRSREREVDSWAKDVAGLLFLLGLAAVVTVIVRSRGSRFLAVGTGLFGLWVALATSFVAGMSISGDWI